MRKKGEMKIMHPRYRSLYEYNRLNKHVSYKVIFTKHTHHVGTNLESIDLTGRYDLTTLTLGGGMYSHPVWERLNLVTYHFGNSSSAPQEANGTF